MQIQAIKMTFSLKEGRLRQFCALEYREQEEFGPSSPERVIIILSESETGDASVFVHPHWRTIASPKHQELIGELLDDFKQRIHAAREKLFEQTSALSVGPLVTYAAGDSLESFPRLREVCDGFVKA